MSFKRGDANLIARLGQFLCVVGHLLEDVGYLCELREPGARHPGEEVGLMQASGAQQPNRGRDSSSPGDATSTTGNVLTTEERAIMAACNADETWRVLGALSPEGKDKLLAALCVMIQAVVEDNGLNERFKGWAKQWGTDDQMLVVCTI